LIMEYHLTGTPLCEKVIYRRVDCEWCHNWCQVTEDPKQQFMKHQIGNWIKCSGQMSLTVVILFKQSNIFACNWHKTLKLFRNSNFS
jgi:hypothetical protein